MENVHPTPKLMGAMKKEEFLKLYREGHRNFSGADLGGMYFDCEDLSGINLEGASLRKTKLCEANLANANLRNADLRGVEIRAELFGENIDFSDTNFEETEMYEGIIQKANFSRSNFKNANFSQFLMTECNCSRADFTNAWLSETDFSSGNFNGAIFRKAYIDVNFFDADITGADFSYAFFRCSPLWLLKTRGIDVANANFANAIFFTPRSNSPDELDISTIQGATCVSTKSDIDSLDLSEYHRFAVKHILEEFAPI
jgi:uncharacterized protein YjbI with pentapeptide repeats